MAEMNVIKATVNNMPSGCLHCRFVRWIGDELRTHTCTLKDDLNMFKRNERDQQWHYRRHYDCPLVEVTE